MNLDQSQLAALEAMRNPGRNVFLTGMAGTGKSTVVGEFVGSSFDRVDLTATTGVAALNLRDGLLARTGIEFPVTTLHRWAGMSIGPKDGQDFESFWQFLESRGGMSWAAAKRRVAGAECLVVDEISMMPGRQLDYLDWHCRRIRGSAKPFGGIRLVVVGDFLQLPPVAPSGLYDWAFQSKAWENAGFRAAVLDVIHRQDDGEFISVLADLREGRVRGRTAEILRKRVAIFPPRDLLRLFTHNAQVDKWNAWQMEALDGHGVVFEAVTSGRPEQVEFLKRNLVTPERLELKVGARVMVTRNLPGAEAGTLGAVNGQTGTVEGWMEAGNGQEAVVFVDCGAQGKIVVPVAKWTFDPQDENSATFRQIPLRPAWAATIHKTQGLSLPAAMADIRAAREPGQAYVACSRVRTLGGLWLKDWFSGVAVSDAAIDFHRKLKTGKEAVAA